MKKSLFLLVLFVLFFSSCVLLPVPKIAELELTFNPNPVTDAYYDANNGWSFYSDVIIREKNNISVALGNYGPNGCCCYGQIIVNGNIIETYYYDESEVRNWFGTLNVEGGSYIKEENALFTTGNYPLARIYETYYGKDENGNLVSCSNTIILDASKKMKKI